MKINTILIVLILSSVDILADGIYMWEYNRYGERSCCLSLAGNDICNPNVACTRNVYLDLTGIQDYISRLMGLEKLSSFPYASMLYQAQMYIKNLLVSSCGQLSYHFDEYRQVKFLHEMIENSKNAEKSAKGSLNLNPSSSAGVDKQKKEEYVFDYLVKLGLAQKWK